MSISKQIITDKQAMVSDSLPLSIVVHQLLQGDTLIVFFSK